MIAWLVVTIVLIIVVAIIVHVSDADTTDWGPGPAGV